MVTLICTIVVILLNDDSNIISNHHHRYRLHYKAMFFYVSFIHTSQASVA